MLNFDTSTERLQQGIPMIIEALWHVRAAAHAARADRLSRQSPGKQVGN